MQERERVAEDIASNRKVDLLIRIEKLPNNWRGERKSGNDFSFPPFLIIEEEQKGCQKQANMQNFPKIRQQTIVQVMSAPLKEVVKRHVNFIAIIGDWAKIGSYV